MEYLYRVIISGDRNWSNHDLENKIEWLLKQMPKNTNGKWTVLIIHGGCRGVDMTADKIARKLGFSIVSAPANWKKYGKAAGPIRNKEMLDMGANAVYAFHQNIGNSKGTKDMIDQAKTRGIPVFLIS